MGKLSAIGRILKGNDPISHAWDAIKRAGTENIIGKKGAWKNTGRSKRLGIEVDSDGFVNREITAKDMVKGAFLNENGSINKTRAAAAGVFGASVAGRVVSGGGLYRDADGNFDIVGIPVF